MPVRNENERFVLLPFVVKETIDEVFHMTKISPEHQFLHADSGEKLAEIQTDLIKAKPREAFDNGVAS